MLVAVAEVSWGRPKFHVRDDICSSNLCRLEQPPQNEG